MQPPWKTSGQSHEFRLRLLYPSVRPTRSFTLALAAGIIWLSWATRLRGLAAHSLWLDEALEAGRAMAPWSELLRSRYGDLDPPLYSVLLRLWLGLGVNDTLLRVPSVVFGVLATALILVWLRRHGPPAVALLGALIFALAPVQIQYAQEVNQYSLVGLLAVATLLAFERHWDSSDGCRSLVPLILVSAVDLYAYYGLIWLILALDAVWLARMIRRRTWASWLAYQVAMLLVALSLLPFSLEGHILRGLAAWKGQYAQLGRGDLVPQLAGGLHGSLFAFSLYPFGDPPTWLLAATYALLLLGAFAVWHWQRHLARLLAPLVLGPVLAFFASGHGLYPFQGRYLLFAAPLVYALLAAGLAAAPSFAGGLLPRRRLVPICWLLAPAFCLLLIAFWPQPLMPVNPWWQAPPREELRPVLARVRQAAQPGDALYVYYATVPAFRYYQSAGLAPLGNVTIQPGWPRGKIDTQVADAAAAISSHRRGWLIFTHIFGDEDQAIVAQLTAPEPGWRVAAEYAAENAKAYLLVRSSAFTDHGDRRQAMAQRGLRSTWAGY